MAKQQSAKIPRSKMIKSGWGPIEIFESNLLSVDGRTVYALPGGGYHWHGRNYRNENDMKLDGYESAGYKGESR